MMHSEFVHEKVNDAFTVTKITWENEKPVTAKQMDWHFSNIEKVYNLWHPNCHIDFAWIKPQTEHPLNAVHWASELYGPPGEEAFMAVAIRQFPFDEVPPFVKQYAEHEHVLIFAAIPCEKPEDYAEPPQYPIYVVHSYSDKGDTTVGMDYCVWLNETRFGHMWAPHGTVEAAGIENFLPQLYDLYQLVDNPLVNRQFDFTVEGTGENIRYRNL